MALKGQKSSSFFTITSTSLTPVLAGSPTVQILATSTQILRNTSIRITFKWDRPVNGFLIGDTRVSFFDQNGKTGSLDNFTGADGVQTYYADLNLPGNSEGTVDITVVANAAADATDATKIGPAAAVTASFQYYTYTLVTTRPSVSIDTPAQVPWRGSNLPIIFRWTEPISGFSLTDDVTVEVNGTVNNTIISNLRDISTQTTWQADIAVPSGTTGTITVKVAADSVQGIQAKGPENEYSKDISVASAVNTAITNATTIFSETRTYTQLNGAYMGVFEPVVLTGFLYFVVQIVHVAENPDPTDTNWVPTLRWDLRGRAELVRIQLSDGAKTVLATYPDILTAPRSLHVFKNKLRFFRGSQYAYEFPAEVYKDGEIDVEGYLVKSSMTPDWRSEVGGLYEVDGTTISKVGSFGRPTEHDPDAAPDAPENEYYGVLGGMASPLVPQTNPNDSTKTDVIGIAGYGKLSEIGEHLIANQEADRLDNWNLTAFTEAIEARIPVLETNGHAGWQNLNALAQVTRSRVGFRGNQIRVEPAVPRTAKIKSAISDSALTLELKAFTHTTIPSTGTVFVEGELIAYTGVTGETLTGLTRGAYETTADGHLVDVQVVFVDHQVDEFLSFSVDNATSQVYNAVIIEYADGHAREPEKDDASITDLGRKELRISTPLARTQTAWADDLAKAYLAAFKDPKVLVTFSIPADYDIHIGDVVFISQEDRAHIFSCGEVLSIQNNIAQVDGNLSQTTTLKLKMI